MTQSTMELKLELKVRTERTEGGRYFPQFHLPQCASLEICFKISLYPDDYNCSVHCLDCQPNSHMQHIENKQQKCIIIHCWVDSVVVVVVMKTFALLFFPVSSVNLLSS